MEQYRHLIQDGDRAEELVNCKAKVMINAPLALHATNVAGYVGMLERLHEAGLLREVPEPEEG